MGRTPVGRVVGPILAACVVSLAAACSSPAEPAESERRASDAPPTSEAPPTSPTPAPSESLAAEDAVGGAEADLDAEPGAEPGAGEPPKPPARRRLPDDARWLYFEDDKTRYASPWWRGRHQLQIAFGCTPAPYYVLDPRCEGSGFHHGYDFAIPCGTPLRAARPAQVLSSAGLGPAYGENALLLRMTDDDGIDRDVVIGHTRRNRVSEGDRIRAGERFAVVSDSAVYTGCHLHFEVREAGGSVSSAVDPRPLLELRPERGEL